MKMILSGLLILAAIVVYAVIPKSKIATETNMTNETGQGIQFIEADWNKA